MRFFLPIYSTIKMKMNGDNKGYISEYLMLARANH